MVWEDPIVAETRVLRQQLMDDGNDLDALVKYLKECELEHPGRLVSLPPRELELTMAAREEKPGG